MNQPKVSIIIPVHNAGHYLEKCLTSLINQTLKEIEIILVLDCPTDGSDKTAEKFAETNDNIKLIYNTENLHTGLSRNKGMEAAMGEYIGFHDHDDYCEPEMYELLYNKAKKEYLEVVRCNFTCVYTSESANKEEQYKYPEVSGNISDRNWIYEYVSGDKVSCVIWNHIYKANFLKKNNLQFLDSRSVCSEDSIFFIEVYDKVSAFGVIPDYLYYHVFHTSNTGKVYNYRSVKNRVSFFEELYTFLKKNNLSEEQCLSYLSKNAVRSLYSGSRQAMLSYPFRKAMKEIQYARKSDLIINCIDYMYKRKNLSTLFRMKPTIIAFSFIMKLFH